MKGIGTNVLIRHLLQDDSACSSTATTCIEKTTAQEKKLYLRSAVLRG